MWFHKNALMRSRNLLDRDVGGQFSPAEVILKGADQRMTAGSEQRYAAAIGLGNVPHQQAEMIIPQPGFALRNVGEINKLLEIKTRTRVPAGNPAPQFARQ